MNTKRHSYDIYMKSVRSNKGEQRHHNYSATKAISGRRASDFNVIETRAQHIGNPVLNTKLSKKSLFNQDLPSVRNTKEVRALIQVSEVEEKDPSMHAIFHQHKFDGLQVYLDSN